MQLAKSPNPALFRLCLQSAWTCVFYAGIILALFACGGGQYTPPPVNLSVSLSNPTITLSPGTSVSVPVIIVAPTETVIFTINNLPPGVSQNYKESESNPSGLLTLQANASSKPGTYKPTIVISSSGKTASLLFTLVISTQI
jgi:hypothetical protein